MMVKRIFDLLFAVLVLALTLPLMLALAIWIKCDSPGSVFFRQERVGRAGRSFRIFKFRTMYVRRLGSDPMLTVGRDPRITRAGSFLRRVRLDEMPQLLNVVAGDMSVVGPRPEVPRYVEHYSPDDRRIVLSVRPGITDLASIAFRNESELLARASDPERTYVEDILPVKLAYYRKYVESRSLMMDLAIIWKTASVIFFGASSDRRGVV